MPDNETPELIPRLAYTKNWENPADYATHQNNEIQNRKDMQSLFAEIATYVNTVMLPRAEQLIASGGGGGGGSGSGGADGDFLPLDGGTMRGILRLFRNPELSAEAATKQYVDTKTSRVAADADGNFTALRQRADEIELLTQNNKGDIASLRVDADKISASVGNAINDIAALEIEANKISALVQDALGNISKIHLDASEITVRVEKAEGDFSKIDQKADEISTLVEDADGNRSEINQRADEILSLIENILGNMSEISQKADEISSNVEDPEGNESEISQKAEEISTSVKDAEGNASEISQKAQEIKVTLENPAGDTSRIEQLVDEISMLVRDALGHTSEIKQTSDEISSAIQDAEGAISEIRQALDAISTRLTSAEGGVSALSQTVGGFETRVASAEGDISTLQQRAGGFETRIEDAEGDISALQQTAEGFETRIEDAEGDISSIIQTIDGISLTVSTVSENGEVYSRLTLKIGPNELYGFIKMDGNVNISGQLSAEALYAGHGEVANLAVNQLTTSRRIVRYLADDTSDDNFIRIYEQNLEFVTGTPTGGTEQAKTPDGAPLFWPVDVSGLSRGADGYPVTAQNERVYTTTTPTAYPAQVYAYEEAVKRSVSFEAVNGIYSPIDRFGAGNQQGNNKAWILKTADGFDIRYLTPDNREIGIRMTTDGKVIIDGFEYDADAIRALLGLSSGAGTSGGGAETSGEAPLDLTQVNADGSLSGLSVSADGYADINGMRKVVSLDFSNIAYGYFSETLDGGILNAYRVQRDASGRIASITDASGHETVIAWDA